MIAWLALGLPMFVAEYTRPPLTDYQTQAFFHPARRVLIEGTTKTGKNHAAIAWMFEQAAVHAKSINYWWVEPVFPQAAISYRRMKAAIPEELRKPNESDMTLTLTNKRVIWFKSGEKSDNLYGEDVGAAIINEASRFRQESWWAMRSTLTYTRGPIRIMGNLKGKKNWFYKLAREAEKGAPDTHYARFISQQAVKAGILDAAEIESARRDLPDAVFRELYMGEATEDGSNPFGHDHIRACVAPLSVASAVVYGVDLAKSVDWTVILGLDAMGAVCHFSRFQAPWKETIERVRREVGTVKCLVDSSGVGDPVLEELQRKGQYDNFEGVKFTAQSKQQMMEGLSVAIQQRKIRYPDGPVVKELEAFEYEYTRNHVLYSAPEGVHDDCVCSLALANMGLNTGLVAPWGAWV